MTTSFQAQGLHMNLHLNQSANPNFEVIISFSLEMCLNSGFLFQIPSAWLTLCDQVFILVLLPFVNLVVYPLMDRRNTCPSPLYRFSKYFSLVLFGSWLHFRDLSVVGMFVSLIAVLVAAIVEHFRLQEWQKG